MMNMDNEEKDEMFNETEEEKTVVDNLDECIIPATGEPVSVKKKEVKKEEKKLSGFDAVKVGDMKKLPEYIDSIKDPDTLRLIAMKLGIPEEAAVNIGPPVTNFLLKYSPLFLPTDKLNSDSVEKYSMLIKDITPIFTAIADTVAHSGKKPGKEEDMGEIERFIKESGDEEGETPIDKDDETEKNTEEEVIKEPPETNVSGIPTLEDLCREQGKDINEVIKNDYYYQARTGEAPIPKITEPGNMPETKESKEIDALGLSEVGNEINNLKMDPKYVVKEVRPVPSPVVPEEASGVTEKEAPEIVDNGEEKIVENSSEKEEIIEEEKNIPIVKKEEKKEEK